MTTIYYVSFVSANTKMQWQWISSHIYSISNNEDFSMMTSAKFSI